MEKQGFSDGKLFKNYKLITCNKPKEECTLDRYLSVLAESK